MKEKIYSCPYTACGKIYSSPINRKRHIDCIHLRLKDFTCQACSRQLSSKQNYREHLSIHTGERPFACFHCGLSFRQGSQLSQHRKTHRVVGRKSDIEELRLTDVLTSSPDRFFNPEAERKAAQVLVTQPCAVLPDLWMIVKVEACLPSDSSRALF